MCRSLSKKINEGTAKTMKYIAGETSRRRSIPHDIRIVLAVPSLGRPMTTSQGASFISLSYISSKFVRIVTFWVQITVDTSDDLDE